MTRQLSRASLLSTADFSGEGAAAYGVKGALTVSRESAMSVPAVKRGRSVICGVVSSLDLMALDSTGARVSSEPWLEQPDPSVTRAHILTWTVDDLLFRGVSWWRVTSRYSTGWPASFERLAPERVTLVTTTGRDGSTGARVYVDGHEADDADLVRFDGPDEGILRFGGRTLRTAIELEEATRRLARLDVPLGYLTPEDGATELDTTEGSGNPADPTDKRSEVDVLLDDWDEARATRNTAFLNRAVKYVTTQLDATKIQLTEQRQAQAVEIARLLNLAPSYVAAPTGDSLTYSTTEGNRRELIDVSLAPFMAPIEQRLSMGDITRRGTRIRFGRAAYMRGNLLEVMQAAQLAQAVGAIDADEIRTEFLGLAPRPAGSTPPAPAPAAPEGTTP